MRKGTTTINTEHSIHKMSDIEGNIPLKKPIKMPNILAINLNKF